VPITSDTGKTIGVSLAVNDITHLKRAERAVAPSGQGDPAAGAWLSPGDCGRSGNAAPAPSELDPRGDSFLAHLAHELRNPLTPILTAAQLLQRYGITKPDLVEWASNSIERQVRQLTRMVNDLLDFSRIRRGKLELRMEPADVKARIQLAVERCRPWAEGQGVTVRADLPETDLWTSGDSVRLSQVLDYLLLHAIRFTPSGGSVDVNAAHESDQLVIRIRDTGIGLESAALETIFQPFFQVREPAVQGSGGLGLELALARSLVAMHGGSLHALSAGAGKGSEFVMRIPACPNASSTLEEEREPVAGEAPGEDILEPDDHLPGF
jgi:signal transduction histidine kinase